MLSMYIYTPTYISPPPPHALNVFSLHTCVSRPRDTRVLLCTYVYLHSNIHIHTYIHTCVNHACKKTHQPATSARASTLFGGGRKTMMMDKGARDGGSWLWIPGCVCFCRWRSCRFGPVPFYGLHLQRRLLHIEELGLRRIRRLPTGRRRASLRYINTYVSCEAITTPGNILFYFNFNWHV